MSKKAERIIITAYLELDEDGDVDIYRDKDKKVFEVSVSQEYLKSNKILIDKHLKLVPGEVIKAKIDLDRI